jgi:hypothetical protein
MSITTQTLRKDYTANGVNTTFAVDFPIFYESNASSKFSLEIITTNTSGIETVKVETTDYTITYTAIENGIIQSSNVVFNTAPTNGHKVSILRKVNLTQNAEFTSTGTEKYSGKAVESALDKITLQVLQIQEALNRVVRLPKSSQLTNIEFPINQNVADEVIVVNSAGDNLSTKNLIDVNLAPVSTYIKTLLDDNTSSQARATLDAQQLNANLTSLAGLNSAANLTSLAGLNGASNKLPYFTGSGAMALQDRLATATNQGLTYVNNSITIANNVASPNDTIDFGAGTYITSAGNQIYVPAITKKIQSTGSWTAGTGQNGLDTGARAVSTFYRTYVVQNNSTLAYDILFVNSSSSPTIPSGYSNLGLLDYALIRVNGSNNIAPSKWDVNNKKIVLGSNESILVFSSTAGSGNTTILSTTEPLEFGIQMYLSTVSAGGSDLYCYGSEQAAGNQFDGVIIATNNGHQTAGSGLIYTSDGKLYWKNFSTTAGVTNQTCRIKSIKIRS